MIALALPKPLLKRPPSATRPAPRWRRHSRRGFRLAQRENLVWEVLQSMCGPGLADRMIRQTIARCGAKSELAASDWAVFASVLASITARIGGAEAGRVILRASGCSPLENAA